MCTKQEVGIFNVWTIIRQKLNVNLTPPEAFWMEKMSELNTR